MGAKLSGRARRFACMPGGGYIGLVQRVDREARADAEGRWWWTSPIALFDKPQPAT